ncbi:uncharacterized protein LOC143049791 [Mytilus galloprovincialis]|uniref:uncharacterized protein LOC143049791 n=1 Tax=Mytilus galloprovincialis TaxID=29158 RepID=UPI003F7CA7A6
MVDLNPYCQLTDPFGMGQERNVLIQAPEKSYKSTGFDRYQERAIPFTQFGICDNPDIKKRHNKQWTIPMSYNLSRILYETIKKIGKTTEETNVFEHVHDRENETVMSDAFDHSHFLKKSRSGTLPMIIRSMSQEQSISYEKDNNKRSIYVSGSRIAVPGIFGTDERKRHRVMNPRQRKMSTEYFQNIKTINTAFLRSQGITMEHFERIIKYCNETIQCVEVHSLPQVDMSMLKMQSMEMVKIAFDLHSSQFQASYDLSSVDGNNSTFGKLNRKNKVSLDQKKTTHGNEQDNRYFSKRKLVQCQMCIDHNEALHWCNTCRRNICNFCKLYHEKVWIVKHHDVQSFQF